MTIQLKKLTVLITILSITITGCSENASITQPEIDTTEQPNPMGMAPYIAEEEPDTTPHRIVSSSVLPNNRGGRPYPPWATRIEGRTDVDPNTTVITVTFDKPGHSLSTITDESGENLWWEGEPTTGYTATLVQLTPEAAARFIEETSVTRQQWVGTPIGTPAHEVKGKFVDVKIPSL